MFLDLLNEFLVSVAAVADNQPRIYERKLSDVGEVILKLGSVEDKKKFSR